MREKLIELIQESVRCARNWAEVIADHLLANGVIVPPCKVGDTVYELQRNRIQAYTIQNVTYNGRYFNFSWVLKYHKGIYGNVYGFDSSRIGKIVFLTRDEAEKALERMED